MVLMHCKTPESSPTFEKPKLAESSMNKYQCNIQTLRNELNEVIIQNKNGKIDNDVYKLTYFKFFIQILITLLFTTCIIFV